MDKGRWIAVVLALCGVARAQGSVCADGAPCAATPILVSPSDSAGWRVVGDGDGSFWRERSKTRPFLWAPGLAAFGIGWVTAGVSTTLESRVGPVGWLPVLGSWVAAGMEGTHVCHHDFYGTCKDRDNVTLWAVEGVAQAAGMVLFFVGLSGPRAVERQALVIAPGAVGSGTGLNATGRF